ncbi:MAG: hypothetical protein QOE63_29 [Acidimicrobiaceae bacterium]
MRSRRRAAVLLAALALVGAATVVVVRSRDAPPPPTCQVAAGATSYVLDPEQAANATTIAAVGLRAGLPDHAVTVALAAALQESNLHNLDYGDLDSLGLFQQRPSQGWGTKTQIMSPPYAATAFYDRLAHLAGWQTLSVTDAAQGVQRSAAPDAYRHWEAEARAMAAALTGETQAGFTCRYPSGNHAAAGASASTTLTDEFGAAGIGVSLPAPRGWAVVAWLIGHAHLYDITTVTFAGQQWSATAGTWKPHPTNELIVRVS